MADERKALIVADLLANVNSSIDGSGRLTPWLEENAAVLGDALTEYGYPSLSDDFREWFNIYVRGNRYMSMPRWDAIANRIESAARELARGDVDSPFHETLLANGFDYSHTTRVWRPYYGPGGIGDTRRGTEYALHHTYRSGPFVVGISVGHEGVPIWEAGRIAAARRTRGTSAEQLRKYLRAAQRREQRRR